jgi:hypothetical protein
MNLTCSILGDLTQVACLATKEQQLLPRHGIICLLSGSSRPPLRLQHARREQGKPLSQQIQAIVMLVTNSN